MQGRFSGRQCRALIGFWAVITEAPSRMAKGCILPEVLSQVWQNAAGTTDVHGIMCLCHLPFSDGMACLHGHTACPDTSTCDPCRDLLPAKGLTCQQLDLQKLVVEKRPKRSHIPPGSHAVSVLL